MIPSISVDMLRSREYKIPPRILPIGLLRARHMDAMTCPVLVKKFKHGRSSKAALFFKSQPIDGGTRYD